VHVSDRFQGHPVSLPSAPKRYQMFGGTAQALPASGQLATASWTADNVLLRKRDEKQQIAAPTEWGNGDLPVDIGRERPAQEPIIRFGHAEAPLGQRNGCHPCPRLSDCLAI
jgi:hypothetical protein